ncbi:hypothetical protein NR402_12020 [Acidithiobacillus ferrooxidans]|uniref:hypothetical protein n=1 Tax=Acidithiobacillus ferrooxidans TaxID=920 RepID=UPI00214C01AD|nr:hypothetical protein [Acidithiobacillus ferrooxidans]MCR2831001.1 hypothetical protein [Acidithiobacillus ferrooxidans]
MDNVASASDFLSRFLPGAIPDSTPCTDMSPARQQKTATVPVMADAGCVEGDVSPISDAIRKAIHEAYGFDPGAPLGGQAAIRIIKLTQGRHVSPQAAASLVRDVERFIPDPRSFQDATDHFMERIQDRSRWNRMYMGTVLRADATLAILDLLHDAVTLPVKQQEELKQ